MSGRRTRGAAGVLAVCLSLGLPGRAWAGGAPGPTRGAWLELRLVESAPGGTFDGGAVVSLVEAGRALGDALPEIPGPGTFAAGYRFGRLTLALGLNLFHDNGANDQTSPGPWAGTYAVWIGPMVAWALVAPRARRPSLYLEAAVYGLLASVPGWDRQLHLPGAGGRLATGSRAFVLPWLALGLEVGADYGSVVVPTSSGQPVTRDTSFGFYGALTLGVVVD